MDFVLVIFSLTMIFISALNRLEDYIKMLAAQGILLFVMTITEFNNLDIYNFIILVLETLVIKAIVIPLFLSYIIKKDEIYKELDPYISNFYSLIITSMIFALGFFISFWSVGTYNNIKPLHFGISISTILAALFIIVNKKKVITHVLGYMILENGIFLLSLSVAREMPIIVDMGILLDLFVGVFLIGIFAHKITENENI